MFRKNSGRWRIIALALVICILVPLMPTASAEPKTSYSDYIVRCGLYYGSTSLASANFQVASGTGTGFSAGYYAADRSFVPLYTINGKTEITVIRSSNFSMNSSSYVSVGSTESNVVGGYHMELCVSFQNQSELDEAVSKVYSATNYFSYPAYTSNGYRVRIGRYTSAENAQQDLETVKSRVQKVYPSADVKIVGYGTNAYTVLQTGSRNILYEFDGSSKQLGIRAIGGSKPETWIKGYKYYGGFDFAKTTSTTMAVISVVTLGDYVKGVTPYELNTSWPEESLKAHALCAQTFAIANRDRHSAYGFDVCTGQHCQVYRGTTQLTDKIKNCVDAVDGMIITYDGKPIDAVYHSSNGGSTENSENVWVGVVPYLRAVPDNFETLTYANNGLWSTSLTSAQLTAKLKANGYSIGTVTGVRIAQLTEAGNVYSIAITDGTKTVTLSKENMRMVLGTNVLLSQNFRIVGDTSVYLNDGSVMLQSLTGACVINGNGATTTLSASAPSVLTGNGVETLATQTSGSTGVFAFEGKGWGHSLGLSQLGSRGMAQAGWTFDKILKYYFTGVKISGLDY